MKRTILFFVFFVVQSSMVMCAEMPAVSPVQQALAHTEETHVEVPSKEVIALKIGKAILAHTKNPTPEANERIFALIRKGQKWHDDMPLQEQWLKYVAHTAEQNNESVQIALESHRLLQGRLYFNYPYLSKGLYCFGGMVVGGILTFVLLVASAKSGC